MRLSKDEFVMKLPFLIKNVEDLDLAVLTRSKLSKANLKQIYKIAALSPAKLKIAPGGNQYILSKTSMKEIASVLKELGLTHNMEFVAEELALLAMATPEIAARLPVLLIDWKELPINVRIYNCITTHNATYMQYVREPTSPIRCLGELVQKTPHELLRTRNLGPKTLDKICELLAFYNLHLEMKFTEAECTFIDYYLSDYRVILDFNEMIITRI